MRIFFDISMPDVCSEINFSFSSFFLSKLHKKVSHIRMIEQQPVDFVVQVEKTNSENGTTEKMTAFA